jgi:hypothetical protein
LPPPINQDVGLAAVADRRALEPNLRQHSVLAAAIVAKLRTLASPGDAEGQRRFGISTKAELLGIQAPVLREIAQGERANLLQALNDQGLQIEK